MLEFSGKLYGSKSGYLLLQVPNSLAIGAFQSLNEAGLTLPRFFGDKFDAHITVMRPEEVRSVGGFNKISERGKDFKYSLVGADSSPTYSRESEYARFWFLKVRSADLAKLRRTYGLPSDPDVPFHITFAARPRHVTFENTTSKISELVFRNADKRQREAGRDLELVNTGSLDLRSQNPVVF